MIRVLQTSFENAAESLEFEQNQLEPEALHIWESPRYSVVLGHSGKAEKEVDLAACQHDGIPVVRRSSGGGTVLIGPGCLNYALLLSLEARPQLHDVRRSFCLLLSSLATTLNLQVRGLSDLAQGDRKVSGNAQRRTRHTLLHHGTLLNNFDLALIGRYLREPIRQPDYRRSRTHEAFLQNLHFDPSELKNRVISAFRETLSSSF
jgi:lipoate-protein ligase A